jgi:trehalose 6-phosphate phosphatase
MLSTHGFSLLRDALLLDVDGTIVDIAGEPDEVRVPSSLKSTLTQLHAKSQGAVALVSGRTVADLDALFAPLTLPAIGCHGAEWRISGHAAPQARVQPLPDALRRELATIAGIEPHVRIEDKSYAMAFHYRLAPEREQSLLELVTGRLAPFAGRFMLLRGKYVLEVKSRTVNKGEAVRQLLLQPPFKGRRPIQFGDDTTDEDAFAAVQALGGVAIAVGSALRNANLVAPSPRAVRWWLAEMAGSGGKAVE